MKKRAYLSLGSNLGDRHAHLERALEEMRAAGLEVERTSSLYETEPVDPAGRHRGHWFLNCVVEVKTELMPRQLLHCLQRIEQRLGRKRASRRPQSRRREPAPAPVDRRGASVPQAPAWMWRGPRTLDMDILFYEDRVIETAELTVPHPRLAERRFVLEPLREIAPGLRHPVTKLTVAEMFTALGDTHRVTKVVEEWP